MANSANLKRLKSKLNIADAWHGLTAKWQQLSARDRMALMVLAVFLFTMVLFGAWSLHAKAKVSQQAYTNKINDYFWLRSQAGNLMPQDASQLSQGDDPQPLPVQVQSLLSEYGIANPQLMASGAGVQMSFEHGSQATVSQALGRLDSQGFVFTNLQIRQDPSNHVLQVQANLKK